jgi:hypothetical protein
MCTLIKLIKIINYFVNSCIEGLLFLKFLIGTQDAYEYDVWIHNFAWVLNLVYLKYLLNM